MESETVSAEVKSEEKDTKKRKGNALPPGFFSENLNVLLSSYPAAPPETRLWLARDIISSVFTCMHRMQLQNRPKYTEYARLSTEIKDYQPTTQIHTYQAALAQAVFFWETAATLHFNGHYSESMIYLGRVLDIMSQIVVNENLTSEHIIVKGRPLDTPTLSDDTISERYTV